MFQIDDIRNVLQSRAENGASSAAGGLTCIFMLYDILIYVHIIVYSKYFVI